MTRMSNPTHAFLNLVWRGAAFDEWWATTDPEAVVLLPESGCFQNTAFRITVEAVEVPPLSPSAWEEGLGQHPYGWKP